ncbi:HAD family acid phosphatase [Saccharothrix xinjiangensis]|uniref:HAD family acid phosphatase n=1 Tax=Saccharothrix xinjiangensis TaxID=204798 RepID=A0ABV9XXJ5_9PSEU
MVRVGQVIVVAAAVGSVLVGGIGGVARQDPPAASPVGEPANLGQAKRDVQAYYNGYVDAAGHNHHSPDSQWGRDTERKVDEARTHLEAGLRVGVRNPAIALDLDDTAESTYGVKADNDFGYDPVKQQAAVDNGTFEVIEPVLELAKWADERGVKVYFISGRLDTDTEKSVRNLLKHGYPARADRVLLRPTTTVPEHLGPCGFTCPVGEFKALVRAHVQNTLGDTIVVNIGDQFSDLRGGHADKHVKLPNPMYHLP